MNNDARRALAVILRAARSSRTDPILALVPQDLREKAAKLSWEAVEQLWAPLRTVDRTMLSAAVGAFDACSSVDSGRMVALAIQDRVRGRLPGDPR